MKKTVSILLLAVLITSLCACAGGSGSVGVMHNAASDFDVNFNMTKADMDKLMGDSNLYGDVYSYSNHGFGAVFGDNDKPIMLVVADSCWEAFGGVKAGESEETVIAALGEASVSETDKAVYYLSADGKTVATQTEAQYVLNVYYKNGAVDSFTLAKV